MKTINPLLAGTLFAGCVSLLLLPPVAMGSTYTSIVDGVWSAPGTWNPAGPPNTTDSVLITNSVTLDVSTNIVEVLVETNGALTFANNKTLQLDGGNIVLTNQAELYLGPGSTLKISSVSTSEATMKGLIVGTNCHLEVKGQAGNYAYITAAQQTGTNNAYIYCARYSSNLFEYADISYLGSNYTYNYHGLCADGINAGEPGTPEVGDITLRNCRLHNNYRPFYAYSCKFFTVEGCEIYTNSQSMWLRWGEYFNVISNNFHDNTTTIIEIGSYSKVVVISYNMFFNNSAPFGDYASDNLEFSYNTISNSGIFSLQPSAYNCQVHHNLIQGSGGGLWLGYPWSEAGILTNNSVYNNTIYGSSSGDGAIRVRATSASTNNIIKDNIIAGCALGIWQGSTLTNGVQVIYSYNCLSNTANYGGSAAAGTGYIENQDPLFVDAAGGDFHLKSKYGTKVGGTTWTGFSTNSPCIDAGDPASDYKNEPFYNGKRVNMGRYGNTSEASKSRPPATLIMVQ